jgi:hypothetical protein
VNSNGVVLPPTPGFARLRDDNVPAERSQYFQAAVYPPLINDTFVSSASELQLAWDFVTVSRSNSLGRVEGIRNVSASLVGADGPRYRITRVERESCGGYDAASRSIGTARLVWGYMRVPFFMQHNRRGSLFPRPGGESRPRLLQPTDTFEAGFVVMIPCSLLLPTSAPATTRTYGTARVAAVRACVCVCHARGGSMIVSVRALVE